MVDVADLKRQVDLVAIVEGDLGPPRRHNGRWLSFVCPFHQDAERDGGSLRVTSDTQTWFCFGCRKTGDAIAWVRERQGVDFAEACRQLGATPGPGTMRHSSPTVHLAATPEPTPEWRHHAERVSKTAQRYLWSTNGQNAREHLNKRGLENDTIREWGLGYNPGSYKIPEIRTTDGKPAEVAKGFIIPVRIDGKLQLIKIRRPDHCNPRYVRLAGGKTVLFGTTTLPGKHVVLLTEGEFDAMLAYQEASDLVGVASTTGGCGVWRAEWGIYLLAARSVLVAYDNDTPGDKAAATLCKQSSRMRRVRVPSGKDVGEFRATGGNVRDWIKSLLGQ